MSELTHFGIIPPEKLGEEEDLDLNHCGSYETHSNINTCTTSFLNMDKLQADWNENCKGNKKCDVSLASYVSNNSNKCLEKGSKVYIQFRCDFDLEEKSKSRLRTG